MKPVTMAVLGAGGRGLGYGDYCLENPGEGRVVAVAEPDEKRGAEFARKHAIPAENVFSDWRDLAARPRLAQAVCISTMDRMHRDPVVALAPKGYHILLEKPMASTPGECRDITRAVKDAGVICAVAHVLRYAPVFRRLRSMLDAGAVGQVVTIEHMEQVGFWHQSHSFVRGNWRNSTESSFMLLAKCCHDVDILSFLVGKPCRAVSSFGSLMHFRKEGKPAGAGAARRCFQCAIAAACPYNAEELYLNQGRFQGSLRLTVGPDADMAALKEALKVGPLGRCVYECDNDVVDHQVVNFQYEGGVTAVLTMTAFTRRCARRTRIMGTLGEIIADGDLITHNDFRTRESVTHDLSGLTSGGHGGADQEFMRAFLAAVAAGDPTLVSSGPDVSLETHLTTFAAEEARLKGTVEKIADYM